MLIKIGFPSGFRRVSIGFPWGFHGVSMGFPPGFHRVSGFTHMNFSVQT